jgi:hypothetical protein
VDSGLERAAQESVARLDRQRGVDKLARSLAIAPVSRRRAMGFFGATIAWLGVGGRWASAASAVSQSCGCPKCHGPGNVLCSPPCGVPACPDPGGGPGHCCPGFTTCCGSTHLGDPCCSQGYDCCDGFACCLPGQSCCLGGEMPGYGGILYHSCCSKGSTCDEQGYCVEPCQSGQFKCGDECCDHDSACCNVGPTGSDEDWECCPAGWECAVLVVPPAAGPTEESPYACCPPGRLHSSGGGPEVCCPEGTVALPPNVIQTAGPYLFCCTGANVCGTPSESASYSHCCDSLAKYPQKCVDGHCEFDAAVIMKLQGVVSPDGNVPVPMSFQGPVGGTLTLEASGTGDVPDVTGTPVAKPAVLGSAHFEARGAGVVSVAVTLNTAARRQLRHYRTLHATAIIALSENGKTASTSAPFTLTL